MTQLDEFTIDFKTKDTARTRSEIAAIDKQLDDMDKKGKKRSDVEEKDYQRLKKHRKELLEDTRQQQRETDKLSQSFQRLASDAVGAVTAWATFSGIKNGLIDVNRLNVGLANLAGQTGISAQKYRELGAAIASSTGLSPTVAQTLLQGYAASRQAVGLPVSDQGAFQYIQHLSNIARQFPKGQLPGSQIRGLPGVVEALPFLQLSPEEQAKAFSFGKSVSGTQSSYDAALKNQEAAAKAQLEVQKIATEENTEFSGAVQLFNSAVQTFAGAFTNHPVLAGAGEAGVVVGGAYFGKKILGSVLRKIFGTASKTTATTAIESGGGASLLDYLGPIGVFLGTALSPSEANPNEDKLLKGITKNTPTGNLPLGIRSNNPGNLMPGGKESLFDTPGAGISALSSQLRRYGARGWDTLQSIIGHYAPPGANDTNAYISAVAKDTGFSATQKLNLSDPTVLQKLIPAIIRHENGYNPYSSSLINQSITGGDITSNGRTVSVKIDSVTVQTAATDAAGIAGAVSVELKNQIRMAMSNFDDGVNA